MKEELNPILALPGAREALAELEPAQLEAAAKVLYLLRASAAEKAEESWKRRKGPMAAYWLAWSAYFGHGARACRRLAR